MKSEARARPRQKKALSQIFLKEIWPCLEIRDAVQAAGATSVIEIGPGAGILTNILLDAGLNVIAVEKDPEFFSYMQLHNIQAIDSGQLKLVNEDITRFHLPPEVDRSQFAICGNIPYSISTDIIQWGLSEWHGMCGMWLMTQLELAERVASLPSHKSYGSLSIYVQLQAEVSLLAKVSRTLFKPVPKVDSAILAMTPRAEKLDPVIMRAVETLTRHAFSKRRKKVRNSLPEYAEAMETLGINLDKRCEDFAPQVFVDLVRARKKSVL